MSAFPGGWARGVAAEELRVVAGALREKGFSRFARAFAAAGAVIFAAYAGAYAPPRRRGARLESQIQQAKIMSDYGRRYEDLRSQLNAAYGRLPPGGAREQWLSNTVRASLDAEGLVMDDFKPVQEQDQNGLLFQSTSVSLRLSFAQLLSWMRRLESQTSFLRVESVDLSKLTTPIGLNQASCRIVTVLPKRRFQ